MSTITSTVPALLKALTAAVLDSPTVTWLGVGAPFATQFRFDDSGCDASAGKAVRKLGAVGLTAVTFDTMPVAVVGIVHLPFAPQTAKVAVSPDPSGVLRGPTTVAARVSTRRQGVIGTNDDD